ncbi:unnamed protein product [Rhizoctonia solani]|uniref:NmrA-like domain-containing protein n=1 Tax=Rhizoctonia solani TaxID=456999 RepID=A0A8H2WS73_9AGAM|nr:unnamed protein product [Rhizoctonia solani]
MIDTTKILWVPRQELVVCKTFAKEFSNQGFNLRILTRIDSVGSAAIQEFKTSGADVLVSTVSGAALALAQIPLIRAAKLAGIKLFFPSEYGGVYKDEPNTSLVQAKKSVLEAAQDVCLPFAVRSNGAFPEYCFTPPFGYDFAERKVTVEETVMPRPPGQQSVLLQTMTIRWLANVLKTIPIEQLQNEHFRIQGNVSIANKIMELWERKHDLNFRLTTAH